MTYTDERFKELIKFILYNGTWDKSPRPKYESDGKPARTKFVTQVFEKYNISKGEFPITSLRPISWQNGIKEILWIYSDQTNDLSVLEDKHGVNWWRQWEVNGSNTIGQRYGATVSRYGLMHKLLWGLKNDPFGRRHIINLWQENDFDESEGLHPCAFQTLWSVREVDGQRYLDLTLVQRSSDYLVAGHINMIQYVALQMMVAHECNMKVGQFSRFTQNLHIYDRHFTQAHELLLRSTPENSRPQLILNAKGKSFFDITLDDFEMINYNPVRPQLKFELGV